MTLTSSRRRFLSPLAATGLALVVAGQSVAASWSAPVKVGNAYWFDGLATLSGSTAIAVFTNCVGSDFCEDKVVLRRSTDGGMTWPHRYVLPGANQDAAIAGRGQNVDLVWASENDSVMYYSHSGDGGQTFGKRKVFSNNYSETEPHVARGPNGLVAICWGEWINGDEISCRVSTNGGASFGRKTSFPTSLIEVSAVAVGNGVVYVAYHSGRAALVVRRSTDGGQTWQLALKITDGDVADSPSLAASGTDAYVAYGTVNANEHVQVRVRRTTDRGASWSTPRLMASDDVLVPWKPQVAMGNGSVHGLYRTSDGVFYTRSSNGVTWSVPEKVVSNSLEEFVGFAGKPLVVYQRGFAIYSRTRQ
jgi:hypothetical protein